MTDNTTPTPGDIRNGYILGEDNVWHPIPQPTRTGLSTGAKIGTAVASVMAGILVLSGVALMSGGNDPEAAPAPVVTTTTAAPAPSPTVAEEDPRDDPDYVATTFLLNKATSQTLKKGDENLICYTYSANPSRWIGKFTAIATQQGLDYEPARLAVEDYFADLCGV